MAEDLGIPFLGRLPLDPRIGKFEVEPNNYLIIILPYLFVFFYLLYIHFTCATFCF